MRSGAKKAVAWACGLGVVVLVGATAMSWDALAERYWLWKLESGDHATALAAARALSQRHSVRAVRPLVERIRATSTEAAYGWASQPIRLKRLESPGPRPREIAPGCTDVYLPPFGLCLHGVGPSGEAALEREIAALDREIALYSEATTAADPAVEQAVHRTHELLRWARRAWRDDGLTVHAEGPPKRGGLERLERL